MKTVISLFDDSTNILQPFADKGWNCIPWDIKDGNNVLELDSAETILEMFEDVDGVIAFPPCTDFTVSGSQYWGKKDETGQTEASMELVRQVLRFTNLFYPTDTEFDGTFFWVMENPVGRLNKLFPQLGKPYIFDPCDFAGYLKITKSDHNELDRIRRKDGVNVTREECDFVLEKNAFTKRTCLWGSFNREMEKKRIEPVRCCKQGSPLQRLGGKSEKTKTIRSQTPEGFAKALFQANHNWRPESWDIENYFNN